MVKKRGAVWNYFTKKIHGSQIIAFCKFCDQSYIQNATRMEKHIERCVKCPENIRRDFMKLVSNKRAKSMISLKLAENWSNQPRTLQSDVSNENFESSREWPFREEYSHTIPDNNTSNSDNVDLKNWHNKLQISSVQPVETMVNREWDPLNNTKDNEQVTTDENDEEAEESNLSDKNHHSINSLQPPVSLPHTLTDYDLEKQILYEQYLERRAFRQTAELELQRKTLEFERFQWQYHIEKTQSEMRWAHECRMMQLKEEQLNQLIKQSHKTTMK
ncbi:uncharacterized protein LOC100678673 [Nasonia vitripennis]|uniref:BED-type domain-containing protein n=1 Tax=Nasonia vitripennis TaxID=7425 RepID=A0A7M7GEJ1_NASVI|nr:uncharacterized protein LOC100678673 [Nasonia vitripennis]